MDRPKRPPPVPKFEDKRDKTQLQAKLNSFMSSISQTQSEPISQPPKLQPYHPVKAQASAQPAVKVEQIKKKANLASINSKLNSMLSAKKININSISAETEKQKQQKEEKNKRIEIQYDPQCPNSYQISKNQYIKLFTSQIQEEAEDEEPEIKTRIQEEVYNYQEDFQNDSYVAQEKEQVALRMMQKFGYKVGEGLGKQGQGIKTPLIVKKVNDSSGIIEQSNISLTHLIPPDVRARSALTAHNVNIQSLIVLVGLLSMQDLEQGLQEEIKEECMQFGGLKEWIVYLFGGELRIFVEYESKEEAFNAFLNMNGKYFGEKLVSVRFYSPDQFHKKNLSLDMHKHIPT